MLLYKLISRPCSTINIIIELVDSISRDGSDKPIYVIQNKKLKNSVQIVFQAF